MDAATGSITTIEHIPILCSCLPEDIPSHHVPATSPNLNLYLPSPRKHFNPLFYLQRWLPQQPIKIQICPYQSFQPHPPLKRLGAYLAAVTDREDYDCEERREREEVVTKPEEEKAEIYEIFEEYDIGRADCEGVVRALERDPDNWVKVSEIFFFWCCGLVIL